MYSHAYFASFVCSSLCWSLYYITTNLGVKFKIMNWSVTGVISRNSHMYPEVLRLAIGPTS